MPNQQSPTSFYERCPFSHSELSGIFKLFNCSTVWSGTRQHNIRKLQLLQNFAARILTSKTKYDHTSASLKDLSWLLINEMLQLKNATMVYECLHGLAPNYLETKLIKRSTIHCYNTRLKNNTQHCL